MKKTFQKFKEPCRKFLFKVSPFPSGDKKKDDDLSIILTSFIRDIKMNETCTTIRFICDEENEVYSFFKTKQPFYISSLNRMGNVVFTISHCNSKNKLYIEEFGHEKTENFLTGVVIIERNND